MIEVYNSPNRAIVELGRLLEVSSLVNGRPPSPTLVMGDLNAKWGSLITDARGMAVWEWVLVTGLRVLNKGSALTCVRREGGSVIDVTFATPSVARRVEG